MTTDVWGYCSACMRWFYCEHWFDKSAAQPLCPVCDREPTRVEMRRPDTQPPRDAPA